MPSPVATGIAVGAEDGDADAGRRDGQGRFVEDFPGFLDDFLLLPVVAVVPERSFKITSDLLAQSAERASWSFSVCMSFSCFLCLRSVVTDNSERTHHRTQNTRRVHTEITERVHAQIRPKNDHTESSHAENTENTETFFTEIMTVRRMS